MGAKVVQQALLAGLLDELIIHVVSVVLGRGVCLLDGWLASPLNWANLRSRARRWEVRHWLLRSKTTP
jgi:dihydrofolate reductase